MNKKEANWTDVSVKTQAGVEATIRDFVEYIFSLGGKLDQTHTQRSLLIQKSKILASLN